MCKFMHCNTLERLITAVQKQRMVEFKKRNRIHHLNKLTAVKSLEK